MGEEGPNGPCLSRNRAVYRHYIGRYSSLPGPQTAPVLLKFVAQIDQRKKLALGNGRAFGAR